MNYAPTLATTVFRTAHTRPTFLLNVHTILHLELRTRQEPRASVLNHSRSNSSHCTVLLLQPLVTSGQNSVRVPVHVNISPTGRFPRSSHSRDTLGLEILVSARSTLPALLTCVQVIRRGNKEGRSAPRGALHCVTCAARQWRSTASNCLTLVGAHLVERLRN